jgi:2-oxoisovalerate dehydrogenase E2 component (dihydrolipoyl transacylase)
MVMVAVAMPRLGESVTEGAVERWLKAEGETVQLDEPLVEVVTDKVTAEIPSPFAGILVQILVPEGETTRVGETLAQIEVAAEMADGALSGGPGVIEDSPDGGPPAGGVAAGGVAAIPDGRELVSPAVRKLAADYGVDLTRIPGTGGDGRVTRQDVLAIVADRAPREELIPLTAVRRQAAAHLAKSASIPHAWAMREVDVTGLVEYRSAHKEEFLNQHGVPLTYLPFMIEVVCQALRAHPLMNSSWTDDAIVLKHYMNVGIAIATEESVVVPVVKAADTLSRAELAAAVHDLTMRARQKQLRPDDVHDGTFTLNNTGALGGVMGMSIINHPQAGILNTESIRRRPVVRGDAVEIRHMMNVTLSFDHRILDGLHAGRFLSTVQQKLEQWEG